MNPISIRLLNQQQIAPQFSKPEEVVDHIGAMQAQEYQITMQVSSSENMMTLI